MAQTSKELIDAMIAAEAALRAEGDAEISAKVQNAENEADANAARESAGAEECWRTSLPAVSLPVPNC